MTRAAPVALLLAAAGFPAAATADETLIGTWDIEVHGGTAQGDSGWVTIYRENGALVGEMTFTDSSARITATERCRISAAERAVAFGCDVLTPSPDAYAPDNFWLERTGPDRLDGWMRSTTRGPTTLTRRAVPSS